MLKTQKCIRCNNHFIFIKGFGTLQIMCPFCRTNQYFKEGKQFIGSLDKDFFEECTDISCKQCQRHLLYSIGIIQWKTKCPYCRSTEDIIIPDNIPESDYQKYIDKLQMKKRPTITLYKK